MPKSKNYRCMPALLFIFLLLGGLTVSAQEAKRRVSITLKDKDPVSGYLISSDSNSVSIEDPDGKVQILSLDDVTMIFIAPKEKPPSPPVVSAPPAAQVEPEAKETETSSPRPTTNAPSAGGPVTVRGYYRKDGTYVKPHTRKAPKKRG